jgi:hypothetical protein
MQIYGDKERDMIGEIGESESELWRRFVGIMMDSEALEGMRGPTEKDVGQGRPTKLSGKTLVPSWPQGTNTPPTRLALSHS